MVFIVLIIYDSGSPMKRVVEERERPLNTYIRI